jgi:hypothetical protein
MLSRIVHLVEFKGINADRLVAQGSRYNRWLRGLGPDYVQTYSLQTLRLELKDSRRVVRKIDDPSRDHWTAVIDTHNYRSPVVQVGHFNQAAQR